MPGATSANDTLAASTGLTADDVRLHRARVGPNLLPTTRPAAPWRLLLRQLTHFFALLLWVAAILATAAGMPQLGVAIAIVVLVNGGFAFVQEYRADRATEKLRDLMPATAVVRRDGHRMTIPAEDLVPDDLVLLEAGDRISAADGVGATRRQPRSWPPPRERRSPRSFWGSWPTPSPAAAAPDRRGEFGYVPTRCFSGR